MVRFVASLRYFPGSLLGGGFFFAPWLPRLDVSGLSAGGLVQNSEVRVSSARSAAFFDKALPGGVRSRLRNKRSLEDPTRGSLLPELHAYVIPTLPDWARSACSGFPGSPVPDGV